ncbi:MAG: hypothetical protein ABSD29_16270 [Verrucomicrobiota bacterium]
MNTTRFSNALTQFAGQQSLWFVGSVLLVCCTPMQSVAQGTMTITFNVMAPGNVAGTTQYSESGMTFWNPYNPGGFALTGAGISGDPQDGTAYLQVGGGSDLSFTPTSPQYFGLVSFDAAGLNVSMPGPVTLEFVGYYAMGGRVTNYFTIASFLAREASQLPDFQTFYPDSQFQSVYRIDVFAEQTANGTIPGWSLDNVVISGVPEPSCGALAVLAALCGLGRAWVRGRRTE